MRCCLISQDDMIISKYAEDGTTDVCAYCTYFLPFFTQS